MSQMRFQLSVFAIIAALCLSASPGVGAIIGLFFGFGIAFFVAGPSFMAAGILRDLGIPVDDKMMGVLLLLLYAAMTMGLAYAAWRARERGDADRARLHGAKAILFGTLPIMGWLSVQALADAWP
ncbi:hypothetical protein [Sphingobium sp. CAP-1]|uniref:hypothetical protein n=1 Tax=Sphingobium sp. CAP-1 TaxID=2676077 RepID=UPI0012BB3425|nr:hypothetical protein [Sphingobium sp. CAP-1]QGP79499.1 hypothetical protein GL174_11320 [Sphingobium sp. CAP-1]